MISAPKRRLPLSLRGAITSFLKFLGEIFMSKHELAYERTLASRPLLNDDTFYRSHYATTDVPPDIPIRLRRLFAIQLGSPWEHVEPADKPHEMYDDLDFAELVYDTEEEFGVSIPVEEMQTLDGSFESLVRCVAAKLCDPPAAQ